jgi:hypothetical protein
MAIFSGLRDYLEWGHSDYWWMRPTVGRVLFHAAGWLAGGAMWSWVTWDEKTYKESLR